jgi:hypothetical protein
MIDDLAFSKHALKLFRSGVLEKVDALTLQLNKQRGRRINLPTGPMPLQTAGPILESTRRRSLAMFGNILAQQTLAPALPPQSSS